MTYGYVRVSTDKQETDNQRFEIERFCKKQKLKIDQWIDETISGTKDPQKRKLGTLIENVSSGDLIICSEISRLGRKLFMIMTILQTLLEKDVKVWTIKDNYRLGDDIQSKILAFAFGMAAEIERDMISQRVKEALARKVAQGVILGRPLGRKSSYTKLTKYKDEIKKLLKQRRSKSDIGRLLNVDRNTVAKFMKDNKIPDIKGHPIFKTKKFKLEGQEEYINRLRKEGFSKHELAMILKVNYYTVHRFMKIKGIK